MKTSVSALLLLLAATSGLAYEVFQGPTELIYWNTNQTANGYTLFGVGGRTYLIDMEGRVAHTWLIGTNPHLLDDGSILDASNDDPSGFGGFKQVSWSNSTVGTYTEARTNYLPHHDFVRISWSAPGHDTDKEKKNISKQVFSIFMSMANQAFFSPAGDVKAGSKT